MIKKTNLPILACIALSVGASGAYAQDREMSPYIGFGYGQYKLEFDADVDTDFDDDQNAFRIFGGMNFTDAFGAEISVYDFDEGDDNGITTDLEAASIAAVFRAPLHERFALFAKAGWFFWEADVETAAPEGFAFGDELDGDDAFFGVGLSLGLTESIDLRLEYDRFELEDDIEPDLDYASASIQVNF
ncbi:porin family protein [Gilvimarinus sp. F26214L]|uniref:porin family protein n=1 Tax=Gilvimarinus sp. DZF01 TaxID=3461371 RepID=UPI004045A8F4